ncbi:MAG: MFS transporter [Treponema sp.]|nr:MFS transporter [Treponema sp.]
MKKSVFAIYFSFFTSGIMCTIFGAILPFMSEEYSLSYGFSGTLLSAHQIGNLFAVLFAGVFPYFVGRKKSTIILGLGLIIGFFLMMFTGNPIALLIAFVTSGISKGSLSNISNVIISEEIENKTAGLNILHAIFAIGALVAPFLVLLVTFTFYGWRLSTTILIILQIISLIFIGKSDISNVPSTQTKTNDDKDFLKSNIFWLNTAILFFYVCTEASVVGWLVTYFVKTEKMSFAFAQSSTSFLWIMIMIGRIICASISNKVNKNLLLVILATAACIFFILMLVSNNSALIITGLLGVGFSMSGMYPTTLATMPAKFNSSTVATGTSIGVATCGAVIMPVIVGFVAEKTGIAGGIATISIAFFCIMSLTIIKLFIKKQ